MNRNGKLKCSQNFMSSINESVKTILLLKREFPLNSYQDCYCKNQCALKLLCLCLSQTAYISTTWIFLIHPNFHSRQDVL